MIKQTKFIYSSLGKAFEKQSKTIKDQGYKNKYRCKYEYEDDEFDKDEYIDEDGVKLKLRLDQYKLLDLKGKSNEYLVLKREANDLINL